MEDLFSKLAYVVLNTGVELIILVFASIAHPKATQKILEKDRLGWTLVGVSLTTVLAGLFVKGGFWGTWLLTLGGLLLGLGVMIAIPNNVTQKLLDWHNVGILIAVAGVYGVWIAIAPFWPAIQEVWSVIQKYLDWTQLIGLVGILAIWLGIKINSLRHKQEAVSTNETPLKKVVPLKKGEK